MAAPRNSFTPILRDTEDVYAGSCDRLAGGAKTTPGAPVYTLTVVNPQTNLWEDEISNALITSDPGELFELV